MSVSYSGGVVTISGSTEASPDTLAGIVTAVGNTALCRIDGRGNFWIGGSITQINIQGWLLIDNGQSMQVESLIFVRRDTSGAGMIFRPRARWIMAGSARGGDQANNSFGTNFNVVCERDPITGEVPLWILDAYGSRDDSFAAYYASSSSVRTPKYRIQGLHIYCLTGCSLKFYPQSDSDPIEHLTITKDSGLSADVEFQTIPNSTTDVVFSDMTARGFTWFTTIFGFAGRKILFDRLRMNVASDYTLEYVHWYGNGTSGAWEFRDLMDIGAGSWNGSVKRTSGGSTNTGDEIRFTYTDRKTILSGATPVQDVNCRWVSSDATNAPALTAASDASGIVAQQVLLDALVPNSLGAGSTLTPTPITWSLYARKYGKDTQPEWAIYEASAFDAARDAIVQVTDTAGIVDAQATADGYTGISLTDHGGSPASWNSKSWRYTITGDLSVNSGLTAANIWHFFESALSKSTSLGGTPGLQLHDMIARITATSYSTNARGGRGVRIVDQLGNPFPGVNTMTANDGSVYSPTVATVLTIAANVSLAGAEIRIYDLDNTPAGSLGTELTGTESNSGATFGYAGAAGNSVWIQILAAGYVEFGQSLVLPAFDSTFTATLIPDTNE